MSDDLERDERAERLSASMLDPRIIDPDQAILRYDDLSPDEISQVVRVLVAIRHWRESEQRVSFESRNQMKLNETDMRALRFLIALKNQGVVVTPGALSEHLAISTASTTKLLDRLERSGHIERSPHPTDRRALAISITGQTHSDVRDTVGRQHAQRYAAAARLSPDERETVIRFLTDLSETTRHATEEP